MTSLSGTIHENIRCILASTFTIEEQTDEATAYVQTSDLDFIQRSISKKKSSWNVVRTGVSIIPAQRIWYALDKVIGPVTSVPPLLPVIQIILQIKQVKCHLQPTTTCWEVQDFEWFSLNLFLYPFKMLTMQL